MGEDNTEQMLQSPMEIEDRSGELLEDETGQKENLRSVQGVDLGTLTHRKRNRKGGRCNLRKSLAWNQAFITEEGVLDPLELSILGRSSAKSNGKLVPVSEMSPLKMHNKSNARPPLHNFIAKSQSKDPKPRKLFLSSNEDLDAHAAEGRTPSSKGIFRNIPRSPATYSQKRVANASATNPTSKLPRFVSTKLYAPSPTSGNVRLTTKSSKSHPSAVKGSVGQNTNVRPTHAKVDSPCSSSSSNISEGNHAKNQVKNGTASLKPLPNRLSLTKHEAVASGLSKAASSFPQSTNLLPRGPPAPAHARPSGLRMPSPSLGFFSQGKVSPSYNNQHQRHAQSSETKILSYRQPKNMRLNCQLQPLATSFGQQPTKGTVAEKFNVPSLSSSSSPACLAESCLNSPANFDTSINVITSSEMKQADTVDRSVFINSESSYCQKDSEESSGFDRRDISHQPGVLLPLEDSVLNVKVPDYGDSSSRISNESFVERSEQSSKTNISDIVCDVCPPTSVNASDFLCSNEPQECCLGEGKACDVKEIQSDSSADNITKYSCDAFARDKNHPIAIDNSQSDGHSHLVSDLGSVAFTASPAAKSSLKEEIACANLNKSFESDSSLSPSSMICDQVAIDGSVCTTSGLNNTLSGKCEPTNSDEKELRDCRLHSDSSNVLMPRNKTCTARKEVMSNAVPFSDEWVAALEEFGEEILEKKTGPVQHSPPDKALPEPGPYSPVKKKAQDIGPFDCTKYSKNLTSSSNN